MYNSLSDKWTLLHCQRACSVPWWSYQVSHIEFPFTTSIDILAFKCLDEGNHVMNFLSSSLWTRWGQSFRWISFHHLSIFIFKIWSEGNEWGPKIAIGTCEWGQCWIFFKQFLYALKFVMDRLLACLKNMGGFLD